MDTGNHDEEDRLGGRFPHQSPARQYHQHLEPSLFPQNFPPPPSSAPPASYASANFAAFSANAALPADAYASVNPDDFYRTYRGVERSAEPQTAFANLPAPAEYMASTGPATRQQQSLRSNGNGTTPKHPVLPATRSTAAVRPSLRSVSAPTDDKAGPASAGPSRTAQANGFAGGGQPSVRDLKKRFDQPSAAPPPSTVRKTSTRNAPQDAATGAHTARSPLVPSPGPSSYAALRSSVSTPQSTGKSPATRSSQRTKFAVEDQVSNNAQSFASRINKPRSSTIGANSQASKSLTHLSPENSPRVMSPPQAPRAPQAPPLLFGEILPGQTDSVTAGYGIDRVRHRRTSESNLHAPRPHLRSMSDPDVEPPSPTDWYRGVQTSTDNADRSGGSRIPKSHVRAQSDLAGSKAVSPPKSKPPRAIPESAIPSSSRLPLSVRKLSTPTDSSSPPASRSTSPTTVKRPPTNGRTGKAIPTAPVKSTATTRAKTPTQSPPKKLQSVAVSPGNTGLAVYVSPAPPKLSPPLRSSRPRQPVSTATTKSSRMKERSRSPNRRIPKPPPDPDDPKRKISIGPVDFAKRRETIKLAYSKSIRESQAKDEARRLAAERKRKAREAAEAVAKETAEKAEEVVAGPSTERRSVEVNRHVPEIRQDQTLKISTDFVEKKREAGVQEDSPTLGIPGSFPRIEARHKDEAPPSAVSNTTCATEFDNETQTEPPLVQNTRGDYLSARLSTSPVRARSVYQSPFEEEEGADETPVEIKISVDSPPRNAAAPPVAQNSLGAEPVIPGAYREEYEARPYLPQRYESTTVTILRRESDDVHPTGSTTVTSPKRNLMDKYADQEEYRMRLDSVEPSTIRHIARQRDEAKVQSYASEDSQLKQLEEFYVGPQIPDHSSKWPEPTFTASELNYSGAASSSGASDDLKHGSSDNQRTPDTSHSLTVPSMLAPANRFSQASEWTDFSIESNDGSDMATGADRIVVSREAASRDRQSLHPVNTRQQPSQWASEQSPYTYSPELSPFEVSGSNRSSFPSKHHPELDLGTPFSPYMVPGQRNDSIPSRPDHEPPPIPTPGAASVNEALRPNSSVYEGTRPGSYAFRDDQSSYMGGSRRASEEFIPVVPTTSSVEKISHEIIEIPFDPQSIATAQEGKLAEANLLEKQEQERAVKDRNRLKQRHNVIKEIIDTEGVFVRDMNVIEEIYKGTAEACPKLDAKTIKLIFRNTDEIINFHNTFLAALKDAVAPVYTPKGRQTPSPREDSTLPDSMTGSTAVSTTPPAEYDFDNARDRLTFVGPAFSRHIEKMKTAHEGFLRSSDHATKRLIQIQEDKTVKVWLNECDEVAKDLTQAWNLDSLLVKPMQRITKYPVLLMQLLQYTPPDHPDHEGLTVARLTLENAILDINKTKKNFELVGQIVGRKRKDSDVRAGFARAFGKRVDKLQASSNRPPEEPEYQKLNEKFQDDYLRLQVVLRDVEYYTRQTTEYVQVFLKYLSSMELIMRLQPSPYPEIESKWVQFNVSMRDMEKIALEQHLAQVRKQVIEPFELVIKAYVNPSLAMKKRTKRRLDYEKSVQLKKSGKKVDKQLAELVEQYEALNDTLKKELPKLSALTEKIGNICLGNLINIQTKWFEVWRDKMKAIILENQVPELADIISSFDRDYEYVQEPIALLAILNPLLKGRTSQSTSAEDGGGLSKTKSRPGDASPRGRGMSFNDQAPPFPNPDFTRRYSGGWTASPTNTLPSPNAQQFYYRGDFYSGINGPGSPVTPDVANAASGSGPRAFPPPTGPPPARPSTGVSSSYDSSGTPRQSTDTTASGSVHHQQHYPHHQGQGQGQGQVQHQQQQALQQQQRRDSNSTHNSTQYAADGRRYSATGLFSSAMPMPDDSESSQRSSRASSRERGPANGYNVLWLAASLFEFNIATTKHEAGYPYLMYQAGEIFDVIAEKGELWLAKNQDDPNDLVGWIWSKHFAKLADS